MAQRKSAAGQNLKRPTAKPVDDKLTVSNQYRNFRQSVDEVTAMLDGFKKPDIVAVKDPELLQMQQNEIKLVLKELAGIQLSCGALWVLINTHRVEILKSRAPKVKAPPTLEELESQQLALNAKIAEMKAQPVKGETLTEGAPPAAGSTNE